MDHSSLQEEHLWLEIYEHTGSLWLILSNWSVNTNHLISCYSLWQYQDHLFYRGCSGVKHRTENLIYFPQWFIKDIKHQQGYKHQHRLVTKVTKSDSGGWWKSWSGSQLRWDSGGSWSAWWAQTLSLNTPYLTTSSMFRSP